jgi:DNA polymerase III alpha subunit
MKHGLHFERFRDPEGRWAPEFAFRLDAGQKEKVSRFIQEHHDPEIIKRAFSFSELIPEEMIPEMIAFSLNAGKKHGFRLEQLPSNDRTTLALIRAGNVEGLPQLDTPEIRELLSRCGLRSLEDLAAISAISVVPGKTDELAAEYADGAAKQRYPKSLRSDILEILAASRGLILYQEQVMTLLRWFGEASLADGYVFVKAACAGHQDEVEELRACYSWKARQNGLEEAAVEVLFDEIEAAAPYTVCKSHHIASAMLSYQAAYLKVHYPAEFARVIQEVTAKVGEN